MIRRMQRFLTTRQGQLAIALAGLSGVAAILSLLGLFELALASVALAVGLGFVLLADAHKKASRTLWALQTLRDLEVSNRRNRQQTADELDAALARIQLSHRDAASDLRVLREQLLVRLDLLERTVGRVEADHERAMTALLSELERSNSRSIEETSKILKSIAATDTSVRSSLEATETRVDQLRADQLTLADSSISEIDALNQVHSRVPLTGRLPLLSGWALSPRALLSVLDTVEQAEPMMILECGSGSSTVFVAAMLDHLGSTARFVTIEHLPEFAARTGELLDAHGLGDRAEIRVAPLVPMELEGRVFDWYSPDAFEDLVDIDLLIVDGPPKSTGRHARYPALPILLDRLSAQAVIMLDDADRPDEKTTLKRWLADTELKRQQGLTKKMAVLARVPGGQTELLST